MDKKREIINIRGQQFGFRKGMGISDVIFIARQLIEKHIERHKDLFLTFADLVKSYDKLLKEVLI